jgi:hypothetical protein
MSPTPARRFARRALGAVVGLTLCALVIGFIALAVEVTQTTAVIEDTTIAIREQQKTNTSTNEAILSCTDPEGACARRNADATADALVSIQEVGVLVGACADRPGTQTARDIERCVLDGLKARR